MQGIPHAGGSHVEVHLHSVGEKKLERKVQMFCHQELSEVWEQGSHYLSYSGKRVN